MTNTVFFIIMAILYGCLLTIIIMPTKSEKLYPAKFEMCKLDPKCSYTVSDIPNSAVQ
jgi:hypothetical protein